MMIDISSPNSKARARDREKVRSLVVASHRKQEASEARERERERRSDSPPTSERKRRSRRTHETARERRKVRRSIGIEIESQEFFIRATLHGARIARNPRGATARPSRQGAAPTPDPILRGV